MIGFVGERLFKDRPDGTATQIITCRNKEQVEFWKQIFPEGKDPVVHWLSFNTIGLGPHMHQLVLQSDPERSQFLKTFIVAQGLKIFARWLSEFKLEIGTEVDGVIAGVPAGGGVPKVDPLETMTNAELKQRANELGVAFAVNEAIASIREKVRLAIAEEAQTAPVGG